MRRGLTLFLAGGLVGAILTGGAGFTAWTYRALLRPQSEADMVEEGEEKFLTFSRADEGVGPGFSGFSCSSCHNTPSVGGWGTVTTLRVARRNPDGSVHAYPDGPVVPLFSNADHNCQAVIPADANVFARRLPTSTFGSGLVDAIPDTEIAALEDPHDRDGDGIRGRAARVLDRASGVVRIGRFGWKAQQASLIAFAADAYLHELGVTTDLYPEDGVLGVPAARVQECDQVADPEDDRIAGTGLRSIDGFVAFMKSLPAPVPAPESVGPVSGRRVFDATGCATCQRPQVGQARAFSDFLLHDIGTGDGIPEADAGPREMRTAALWGIRDRRMYLHNGSATSIEEAIARHAGEATATRARFSALTEQQKRDLVTFVKGL